MIKMVNVAELLPMGEYRLWLRFSDGSEGVHDFAKLIAEGGEMVEPLRDRLMFQRAFLSLGVPTWPNGFDLDAINLHIEMKKAEALRQAAVMTR